MNGGQPSAVDLENRAGLPEDLLFLLAKYPREDWQAHDNIHGLASMWLERHDMFRELGGLLEGAIAEHREGKITPDAFARFFAPRLRFFLGQLSGHHAIEDEHYFPLFATTESRLARGFEILDSDHHVIHDALGRNAEAGSAFLRALQQDADAQRLAADAYADANAGLVAMLRQHLTDEEDLIIPLILERGIGM